MNEKFDNIAFIVGAGAVENAWDPIIKILKKPFPEITDADSANCFFARFIYLMRFYATSTFPHADEALEGMKKDFIEMKEGISQALIYAQNNNLIRHRPEIKDILHKFIFSTTDRCVFISTNWDTVLDNYINELGECNYPFEGSDIPTHHIHGSVCSPNGLYFPSEVVKESYRTGKEDLEMGNIHGSIWQTIEGCNKTVLYGLSLDPLDAELSQTLAAGWSSANLREVIIINPDHKKVAKRVKLLLDPKYSSKIKVTGYCPSNLNMNFVY